jgi:hypothetical protein
VFLHAIFAAKNGPMSRQVFWKGKMWKIVQKKIFFEKSIKKNSNSAHYNFFVVKMSQKILVLPPPTPSTIPVSVAVNL